MSVEVVRMFLPADQLAQMRADVEQMLPDVAIISAGTATVDSAGFPVEAYVPVTGGTVACRIDPLRSRALALAERIGRETLTDMYQLTVPYDAPLTEINLRVETGGRVYNVVQMDSFHSLNVSRRGIVSIVR